LLRLGEREKVLPVFDMTDDPEALTQFIFRCRPRGVGVEALLDLLDIVSSERQGASRRFDVPKYAILLSIGEFTLTEIPESRREPLLKQMADSYRNDPSSGVHGAAGWLLRQWGQTEVVREVDQTPVPYSLDREWFTLAITVKPTAPKPKEELDKEKEEPESEPATPEPPVESLPPKTFYYTFSVFPSGSSKIGSFDDEPDRQKDELRHAVTLTRPFALLDREVTFEELIAFAPQYAGFMKLHGARPDDAGYGSNWSDSISFSRWLGQQSGLLEPHQSYPDPETHAKDAYPREPNPAANWAPSDWPLELGRRGFRLPTESEWEFASRAGVRTSFGYGSDMSLLGRFGWFGGNSGKGVHPPRELRPSQRGLFDLHGNLFGWMHDGYTEYEAQAVIDPLGTKLSSEQGSYRVMRGGSWDSPAAICRSAVRAPHVQSDRNSVMGFRLALSPSSESGVRVAEPAGVGTEGAPAEQRPEMP